MASAVQDSLARHLSGPGLMGMDPQAAGLVLNHGAAAADAWQRACDAFLRQHGPAPGAANVAPAPASRPVSLFGDTGRVAGLCHRLAAALPGTGPGGGGGRVGVSAGGTADAGLLDPGRRPGPGPRWPARGWSDLDGMDAFAGDMEQLGGDAEAGPRQRGPSPAAALEADLAGGLAPEPTRLCGVHASPCAGAPLSGLPSHALTLEHRLEHARRQLEAWQEQQPAFPRVHEAVARVVAARSLGAWLRHPDCPSSRGLGARKHGQSQDAGLTGFCSLLTKGKGRVVAEAARLPRVHAPTSHRGDGPSPLRHSGVPGSGARRAWARHTAARALERQLQDWALGSWGSWSARTQRLVQAALLRPVLGLADRGEGGGGEAGLEDVRAELPPVLGDAVAAAGQATRLGLPVPQALAGLALECGRLESMAGQLQGLLVQLRQVRVGRRLLTWRAPEQLLLHDRSERARFGEQDLGCQQLHAGPGARVRGRKSPALRSIPLRPSAPQVHGRLGPAEQMLLQPALRTALTVLDTGLGAVLWGSSALPAFHAKVTKASMLERAGAPLPASSCCCHGIARTPAGSWRTHAPALRDSPASPHPSSSRCSDTWAWLSRCPGRAARCGASCGASRRRWIWGACAPGLPTGSRRGRSGFSVPPSRCCH